MIVRIQQFEVADAERLAGWPDFGVAGSVRYDWPSGTDAFEILVRDADERHLPVPAFQRRDHLRSLIWPIVSALTDADVSVVARLDGPLVTGELLGAYEYLTDPAGSGRFGLSAVEKLDPSPASVVTSVRIEPVGGTLASLCEDLNVGLARSVRLRVFGVPGELVNPLLDTSDPDDERWGEILDQSSFVLQTIAGLDGLQVITRRFGPQEISQRLGNLAEIKRR